jgi:NTE family protein
VKIGLALGSGSSRGWSHIGIIKALNELGINPDIVCGTSAGAIVGAAYVANNLENLENWALSITKFETAKFFELKKSFNGFINNKRLQQFLIQHVAEKHIDIESLEKRFAAVATDLKTGREVWLNKGSLLASIWPSFALPGLFSPVEHENSWLIDGGLVNPVPVSLCRALGADFVIAVNLNGDIVGRQPLETKLKAAKIKDKRDLKATKSLEVTPKDKLDTRQEHNSFVDKVSQYVSEKTSDVFSKEPVKNPPPTLFETLAGSINIFQDRITKSRMAGDPPDILLTPRLADIGLLELYRAKEAIAEGHACVERMAPEIQYHLTNLK